MSTRTMDVYVAGGNWSRRSSGRTCGGERPRRGESIMTEAGAVRQRATA